MKLHRRISVSIALVTSVSVMIGRSGVAQEMPVQPEPSATAPSGPVSGDEDRPAREIRMLPTHKTALILKPDERNPYARRTSDLAIEEKDTGEETESDRIRRVLTGLAVSGRTYGPKGIRLLAGDVIFEAGKLVPQVVEDQSEVLVVENVTEELVAIGWLDPETGERTGKRLTLTYDLSPKVGYVLPGQGTVTEKAGPKFGVIRRKPHPEQPANNEAGENKRQRVGSTESGLPGGISSEVFKQGQ